MGEANGLVVKLPFATPEEFLAKYGANITRGGIYLRSRSVKPPGTPVNLDLKLADGTRLIYATAVVHFVTGQGGQGISGMGLRFLNVDPETLKFLDSSVATLPHGQSDLPPLPAGVGPADESVPAHTPHPGAIPTARPAHTPHPGALSATRPAHTPHPGALSAARPAHTPHPGALSTAATA
ncbi:MAG TPA: TIGR02266 family protein, partial [Archangium sp.]|nr:TIGR02266 family protein [Archangium sp.]